MAKKEKIKAYHGKIRSEDLGTIPEAKRKWKKLKNHFSLLNGVGFSENKIGFNVEVENFRDAFEKLEKMAKFLQLGEYSLAITIYDDEVGYYLCHKWRTYLNSSPSYRECEICGKRENS